MSDENDDPGEHSGDERGRSFESDGGTSEEFPLSLDAMLVLVSNRHRRHLLEYLMDQPNETGSFEDVTRHLVREEAALIGSKPDPSDIELSLQHLHLPKFAAADVLEYDVRSREIRYRENERLERLLSLIQEFQTE